MARRALLVLNRRARQTAAVLPESLAELQALGFEVRVHEATPLTKLSDVIRSEAKWADLAIIGGGDGTLNAALEGLVDTQLPLGILPLGTANDLARTLALPTDVPSACRVIAAGRAERIDLGWVNGKHFLNVASIGLSVRIARRLSPERKRRLGPLAYLATAAEVLVDYRPFRAEIRFRGESFRVTTIQVAVGNGRYYGGGMTVAEDASIADQRLDLYSLEVKHWWHLLPLLPAMKQGSLAQWPHVRTFHGEEFEVITRRPRAVNTDGELTTWTPATFRLAPHAISVFVPPPLP